MIKHSKQPIPTWHYPVMIAFSLLPWVLASLLDWREGVCVMQVVDLFFKSIPSAIFATLICVASLTVACFAALLYEDHPIFRVVAFFACGSYPVSVCGWLAWKYMIA